MSTMPLPLAPQPLRPIPILEPTQAELAAWLQERGFPALHARQIRRWVLAGRAADFAAMTDLPLRLREALAEAFTVFGTAVADHRVARDGTQKLVLRLRDGEHIECVLLLQDDRRTACISTQAGCGMGCVFCASGINGLARNLTVGEILEQLVRVRNQLPAEERLTHVVVMGMGEPLANLGHLLAALEAVTAKEGLGIGARHVTISTVGLPAKIRELADLGKQYHLAVSLHAPTDALRTQIVPTNDKVGLGPILDAADYFYRTTGRQVTYEYVVLGGLNDARSYAQELVKLLRGRKASLNLIPFNEVAGLPYRRPTQEALTAFVDTLRRGGITVKVRKRKGSEIDAACGQLRRQAEAAARKAPAAPEPVAESAV
jgi:23S rRNA (adenine2503-C2)-methyltransferase